MSEESGLRSVPGKVLPVRCPRCGSADVRPSYSTRFRDALAGMFALAPYRCRACRARFYRRKLIHADE